MKMKDKILRRISMKITEEKAVEINNSAKKDVEVDKPEDKDDYLVKTIGAFGLWQAVVSVTVTLTRGVAMWNMTSLSFLTPVNDFVCVQFNNNATTETLNSTCYDDCLKYKYSSITGGNIVEEFGLICQNAWLAGFAQSVMMMGLLVGVSLFGWISDRFGRRTAILQSTFLNAVSMIALPFSPNYIIFTSIRFIIGVACSGCLLICVVLVMEIIGKQYREIAGALCFIPDGLAIASLAGFAYFTSNWQAFTLSYGVATCLIFVLIIFVPESPRWLVAHGQVDEAIKVITRAANRNKLNTSHIESIIKKAVEDLKIKNREIVKASYLDFFKHKSIIIRTLTIFITWFVQGLCLYGIYQYVTIISVDPYLTVVMLGLVQIPFWPVGIIINRRFGRKITNIGILTTMAILMLILTFVPKAHWAGTMLGIVAFILCNICISISYIYVSELYPTPLRNMSFAFSSGGSRIGSMIAPFIASLSLRWLPSVVFCVIPLIGGLCYLTLPETKGQNLNDAIEK